MGQAVKKLDDSFNMVIMDLQMPEMDGLEATKILRDKGIKIPIIGLSANTDMTMRAKCLAAGVDDFLTKPVKLNILLKCIKESLAK